MPARKAPGGKGGLSPLSFPPATTRPCLDEEVAARIASIAVFQHPTLEALERHVYQIPEDVPMADLEVSGQSGDGESITLTFQEYTDAIAKGGGMGYAKANADRPEIHLWFAPSATPEQQAHILGHEIGHLVGSSKRGHVAEEKRADTFGAVAAAVVRMLSTRL